MKTTLLKFAAPLATLALAISITGCPNNQQPPTPSTSPKTPKPSADASGNPGTNPSATPTLGSGTNPSATPSGNATTLPSGTPTTGTNPSATPSANPSATPSAGTTPTPTPTATATSGTAAQYVQVERLGRPAINEGLIVDNTLLNTWNSVMPNIDATDAAKPIADEAKATLKALGNTDPQIATLFGQLLPDVMRIDTTKNSGYAVSAGQATIDNLSPTKKIPIGGRLITDDVVDITLLLIVPDATHNAVPNLRSDGVAYKGVHKDVLNEFPYLPAPN